MGSEYQEKVKQFLWDLFQGWPEDLIEDKKVPVGVKG